MGTKGATTTLERPRQFAREIVRNRIGKDRYKRTEKDIALSLGYSPVSARKMTPTKRTKAFQEAYRQEVADIQGLLERERLRVIEAMSERNLSQVKYNQLSEVLKTLTHDIQLIGGNATERTENEASQQLAGLLNDMRTIAQEKKLKQAAIVQEPSNQTPSVATEPLELPRIEPQGTEEGEAVQS